MLQDRFGRWLKALRRRSEWSTVRRRETHSGLTTNQILRLEDRTLLSGPEIARDINQSPIDLDWRESYRPIQLQVLGSKLIYWAYATDGASDWLLVISDGTGNRTETVLKFETIGRSVVAGDWLYFIADDGFSGEELWKTDGTLAGTQLVRDIFPGPAGGVSDLTEMNGAVFFAAATPSSGIELWKSDGTAAGTVLVKDIRPGTQSAGPANLKVAGNRVYFSADDGATGRELWSSDGTAAGTLLVKDVAPGSASALSPYSAIEAAGNLIYFAANDGAHGLEPWRTDGTSAGTTLVQDIFPGANSSMLTFSRFSPTGDSVYFGASDGVHGREPWKTNGTNAGAAMVADVLPGGGSSDPQEFTTFGNQVFFSAVGSTVGNEIWKTDGTAAGTVLFADFRPGSSSSYPGELIDYKGELYFQARNSSGNWLLKTDGVVPPAVVFEGYGWQFTKFGNELFFLGGDGVVTTDLWKTDGTTSGTIQVGSVFPGRADSRPRYETASNGLLFFGADDGVFGHELWRSDGTFEGTFRLGDFLPGSVPSVPSGTEFKGQFYFTLRSGPNRGDLFKSDGTVGGTVLVKDFDSSINSSPSSFTELNGQLFFTMNDGINGSALWRTDGTTPGTVLVRDAASGSLAGSPFSLMLVGGRLYFGANDAFHGREIWSTDGTDAGTAVIDAVAGPGSLPTAILGSVGSNIYFQGARTATHVELWVTDGTVAGTRLVKDIQSGAQIASIESIQAVGNQGYFLATGDNFGRELWITDGTTAGTRLVKDIEPGPGGIQTQGVGSFGSIRVFTAVTSAHGAELWRTDGTDAGTFRLTDLDAGTSSSQFTLRYSAPGFSLVYVRLSNSRGQIWRTDGTAAGTILVKDFGLNGGVSRMVEYGGRYFFVASDGASVGLWVTDGTGAGTRQISKIDPIATSVPFDLTLIGSRLFFPADTELAGNELMSIDLATNPALLTLQASPVPENTAPGTNIGRLEWLTADPPASLLYSLVAGFGDQDNGRVSIIGDQLVLTGPIDYESEGSLSIRIRATNPSGAWVENTLHISLVDVNEAPTAVVHTLGSANFPETFAPPVGFTGNIVVTDDALGTNILGLSGPDAGYFSIVGTSLRFHATSLDYETKSSYVVTITVDDPTVGGPVDASTTFTFFVSDMDEYDVTLAADANPGSNSVPENSAAGTTVGLTAFAVDADGTLNAVTYSLADNAGGRFVIHPTTGVVTVAFGAVLNYEAATSHAIAVQARSADGSTSVQWFTIAVTDMLEPVAAPSDVDPVPNQVLENSPGGSIVGVTAYAIDPDGGPSAVTYSLVDDAGGRFWIHPTLGGVFVANGAVLDYEAATSHSITVKASSTDGTSSLTTIVIKVLDSPADNQPGPRAPQLIKDIQTDIPGQIEGTGPIFKVGPMMFFTTSLYSSIRFEEPEGHNLYVTYGDTGGTFLLAEFPQADVNGLSFLGAIDGTVFFSVIGPAGTGRELWKTNGTPQGTLQVRDINPGRKGSYPSLVGKYQGVLYFTADDGVHGRELWRSDGTAAGTTLVKDINPGTAGSQPDSFQEINGRLTFLAAHPDYGNELWTTDGTEAGTTLVVDLRAGAQSSGTQLGELPDGRAFFLNTDAAYGEELWITDRTAAGTSLVKDILPGAGNSFISSFKIVGNKAYFTASDGVSGWEPWVSDGTAAGTGLLKDIYPGTNNSSSPADFFALGNAVYFTARDGVSGRELWRTDGTAAGTLLVADITPGLSDSSIASIQVVGSTAYFRVRDREFWKTDGTAAGTQMLSSNAVFDGGQLFGGALYFFDSTGLFKTDGTAAGTIKVATLTLSSEPLFTENAIYFTASDPTHGGELWKSDGTTGGTLMLKDIKPGKKSSYLQSMTFFNGKLYFAADSIDNGSNEVAERHWWTSDGTQAGTVLFHDSFGIRNRSLDAFYFTEMNGLLYFANWSNSGVSIWKSDGTAAGTIQLPTPVFYDVRYLTAVNGKLYFQGALPPTDINQTEDSELWVTDGTLAGTVRVKDIRPGIRGSTPRSLVGHQGLLYFNADDGTGGRYALWRSDGTAAGTVKVPTSEGGTVYAYWRGGEVNGTLYFSGGSSGPIGTELWKIDPSTGIAVLIKDINPGPGDSRPGAFASFQGAVYFYAGDVDHGYEIWKTDGTAAGTIRVTNLYPAGSPTYPGGPIVVGNTIYFQVIDLEGRVELWKTDGSVGGESLVRTFPISDYRFEQSQLDRYQLQDMIGLNGVLYFTALDDDHGRELWKSDGTAAGTVIVADVWPGPDANFYSQMLPAGDRLFFIGNDGVHGQELWESDGTAAGTLMHGEISPGQRFGPTRLVKVVGNKLFLVAESFTEGMELWSLALDPLPVSIALDATSVSENTPAGQIVGRFTTTGTDSGPFSYALVPGAGDTGNSSFSIVGNELRVAAPLDFETRSTWSIRVRSTNAAGATVERVFEIAIRDVNEAPTAVRHTLGLASIGENGSPPFIFSGNIVVTDDALGTNVLGLSGPDAGYFSIVGAELRFIGTSLNYELKPRYDVTITVDDPTVGGPVDASTTFTFVISDVDEYDVTPVTDANPAPNSVPENSPAATVVGLTAFASDADGSVNAITYSLLDSAGGRFAILPSGVVIIASAAGLNYEAATFHNIAIQARSADGSTSVQWFTIAVTNVDEPVTAPVDVDPASNRVAENSPDGTVVGLTMFASDPDSPGAVTYSLSDDAGGRFRIHPTLGGIFVANGAIIDREGFSSITITVMATSVDGSSRSTQFSIDVVDVNEPPSLNVSNRVISLPENSPTPAAIANVTVKDDALGTNNVTLTGADAGFFELVGGALRFKPGVVLDYETKQEYWVTVNVDDPSLGTGIDDSSLFVVNLTNVQERPVSQVVDVDPVANRVVENAAGGSVVGLTFFATPPDSGGPVTYSLLDDAGGRFRIHPTLGGIFVTNGAVIDRETAAFYTIVVKASGSDGSSTTATYQIDVMDVNEAPGIAVVNRTTSLPENSATPVTVGTIQVTDDLLGTNSIWLTGPDASAFEISGNHLRLKSSVMLDFESKTTYSVTINVDDPTLGGAPDAATTFVLNVTDLSEISISQVIDVDPVANRVKENAADGSVVGLTFSASDPDSGPNAVTYSLLDDAGGRFWIHPTFGGIFVANGAIIDYETDAFYDIRVKATSSDGSSSVASCRIDVGDDPDR